VKELLSLKKFNLYIWIGLAWIGINMLSDGVQHHTEFRGRAINELWLDVYLLVLNYILLEYTIPGFRRRHWAKSAGLMFLHLILYSAIFFHWRKMAIQLGFYTPYEKLDSGDMLGIAISSIIFFAIIRFIVNYFKLRRSAKQLLIEKQQAELNYLKAQTNPHFLFNTLNNIYALSREKSDQAPESILRLSGILRFMLYEASGQYIAIEKELKIIDDYISLEKLRYDESLRVNFNYNVEDMKQALPPLLLIPLVENAFKHGVSETRVRPFVDIHLSIIKLQLAFHVKNSTEEATPNQTPKEFIGLSNLRRQLELQYTDYNVSLEQRPFEFSAILKINLASHV
jgi:sensor histidine kinase YesM